MEHNQLIMRIKAALADRNISVVAENLNMSSHTIYRLLNDKGKTINANLHRLAEYLNVKG